MVRIPIFVLSLSSFPRNDPNCIWVSSPSTGNECPDVALAVALAVAWALTVEIKSHQRYFDVSFFFLF